MLMPPFTLHHPESVEQAVKIASELIQQGEEFDWVAGGTDVVPNYKWRINPKPHVISLAKLPEANQISKYEIGCMTKLSDLTKKHDIHPLIVEAASKIASSLIRKSATVGGNLCLDTRCFCIIKAKTGGVRLIGVTKQIVEQVQIVGLFRTKTHSVSPLTKEI